MFDNRAAVGSLGEQSSEGPRFNPGGITGSPAPTPKKGVKRKLDTKTYETKYDAIMEVERGSLSKKQIAEKFGISSSTLSTWLKNAESIRQKVTSGEVGASIHPKGPKRTQRDPKGPKRNPKGPKRNPKERKTDFLYMIKVQVLFKKKDKYKCRKTQMFIFGHFFIMQSLKVIYTVHIYSIHQPYLIYRFLHFMKDII